ncbi:DHS-like NAD/FAD-binding domain-containing protein [Thelonectria olida]|uniref:DHS-like NAD/FAD-binding domain-containing protein n=1 Tax=Thelonectria olida TaxID=1576542 RepID=A0A9P8VYQ8_9HYPO|nr:DHS-like NAD/FAD-binding domain-containing protein [Thelonectria olida]
MGQEESSLVEAGPPKTLADRSLSAVAEYIKSGRAKRIVVLTGAGISTAAGIPDFRSPKTGLYNNLARLNLPYAEAVFDISYFRNHPEPFYVLAKELYPGHFHPTVSHAFITLLARKGLLQMLFTQNIDCLERSAGVPSEKIVEAHGSFATQRCIECKTEFPDDKMKEHVLNGKVPHCGERDCKGLVKPDIVFFGEPLPKAFDHNTFHAAMADLTLIIGTSLTVYPFAGLPKLAQPGKPRVLFNMEQVGEIGHRSDDVLELGSCDDGIRKLADELGWRDELEKLWREVVGDKEADRQLGGQAEAQEKLEEDLEKLVAEVEAVVIKDDNDDNDAKPVSNNPEDKGSKTATPVSTEMGRDATHDEPATTGSNVLNVEVTSEPAVPNPSEDPSQDATQKSEELEAAPSNHGEVKGGKAAEETRGANQTSEAEVN